MTQPSARCIWVLGATSAIAHAYARRRAGSGAIFVLFGRHARHLEANAADLQARGSSKAVCEEVDLAHEADPEGVVTRLHAQHGPPDEVLVAYGMLGEHKRALADIKYARDIIETNFTSTAAWLLAILGRNPRERPLTVAVIGSVAGDRGRASNFVYGAAKGGLDRFVQGLQHTYAGTSVRFLFVKPGFIDTPMTAGVAKSGPLWASPERVAADIERAVDKGRGMTYSPWFWSPIMLIIRSLPPFIFNRLRI